MPSGNKYVIAPVIELVEQIQPKSVLDIGLGFGKWGFLLREYLEIWKWDRNLFEDDEKFNWSLRIDGVEIYEKYVKDLQRSIYNNIFIEDVFSLVDRVNEYDLLLIADVIEHFEKEKGKILLDKCFSKAKKAVLVVTPIAFFPQGDAFNNPAEKHISLWTKEDFKNIGDVQVDYIKGNLFVVLNKMDKKFHFENRYKVLGFLNRIVAFLQSQNIRKYGIDEYNKGILLKFYNLAQDKRGILHAK